MTTALTFAAAVVALACPLHMLWRTRQGKRGCGSSFRSAAAPEHGERQRALAERVRRLARTESAPGRR